MRKYAAKLIGVLIVSSLVGIWAGDSLAQSARRRAKKTRPAILVPLKCQESATAKGIVYDALFDVLSARFDLKCNAAIADDPCQWLAIRHLERYSNFTNRWEVVFEQCDSQL